MHDTNTQQTISIPIRQKTTVKCTFNDQQLLYREEAVCPRTSSTGALHHHVGELDARGIQALVADTRSVVHQSLQQQLHGEGERVAPVGVVLVWYEGHVVQQHALPFEVLVRLLGGHTGARCVCVMLLDE